MSENIKEMASLEISMKEVCKDMKDNVIYGGRRSAIHL